jgi:hypothetical protein
LDVGNKGETQVVVSSRWFLLNRPEIQESIVARLAELEISDFTIETDFQVSQGEGKDPFVGVFIRNLRLPGTPWEGRLNENAVIIAVGCSGMNRALGELGDAYIGLRAWPPFGGAGYTKSQKGTLGEGEIWARQYREELNSLDISFQRDWGPAHMQWIAWRDIPNSDETPLYRDALCEAVVALVVQLTR